MTNKPRLSRGEEEGGQWPRTNPTPGGCPHRGGHAPDLGNPGTGFRTESVDPCVKGTLAPFSIPATTVTRNPLANLPAAEAGLIAPVHQVASALERQRKMP
jgi:hypothetical protein